MRVRNINVILIKNQVVLLTYCCLTLFTPKFQGIVVKVTWGEMWVIYDSLQFLVHSQITHLSLPVTCFVDNPFRLSQSVITVELSSFDCDRKKQERMILNNYRDSFVRTRSGFGINKHWESSFFFCYKFKH